MTLVADGEVEIKRSADLKVSKLAAGLAELNPRTQLEWNVRLEPGEKGLDLTYGYSALVSN